MSRKDFKKITKANNAAEHARVIEETKNAQAKELNEVTVELIAAKKELDRVRKITRKEMDLFDEANNRREMADIATENARKELNEIVSASDEAVEKASIILLEIEDDVEEAILKYKTIIESTTKDRNSIMEQISILLQEKEKIGDGIAKKKTILDKLNREINKLNATINKRLEDADAEISHLNKAIMELSHERDDIQLKLENEKKSLGSERKMINDWGVRLEKEDYRLNIYRRRIEKAYKELNIPIRISNK